MSETRTIATTAAASLNDELAREIAECIDTLRTEADIGKRRSAERRFIALTHEVKI